MNYSNLIDLSVRLYKEEKKYTTKIGDIERTLPIVEIDENMWIASNASVTLGDVEFAERIASMIASKYKNVDVILTSEAKAIGIAYSIARNLGVRKIVIARKSQKGYMKKPIIVGLKSITTQENQKLVLDENDAEYLDKKRCLIFDDVISTGGTTKGLLELIRKIRESNIEPQIVGISTIWLEGPWPWQSFYEEITQGYLKFLSTLPIFCKEKTYRELSSLKNEVKRLYE